MKYLVPLFHFHTFWQIFFSAGSSISWIFLLSMVFKAFSYQLDNVNTRGYRPFFVVIQKSSA